MPYDIEVTATFRDDGRTEDLFEITSDDRATTYGYACDLESARLFDTSRDMLVALKEIRSKCNGTAWALADAAIARAENGIIDWYERRHELEPGQIFTTFDGSVVKLDRRVPGDGTKWYVADWMGHWSYEDSTIEPGDLVTRLPDNWHG